MRPRAVAAACAALALWPATGGAQVFLRGHAEPLPGQVRSASPAGVTVAEQGGEPLTVSWDRVRHVAGPAASSAAPLTPLAQAAFRARARVERGDWRAAEPLLEELFAAHPRPGGPTGAVIAQGLLRCRLQRGAQAASIVPWLAWLDVRRQQAAAADKWEGGRLALPPIIDPRTELVPALPPIWLPEPGLRAALDSPAWDQFAQMDAVVAQLAALYRHAAAAEAGAGEARRPLADPTDHPGVRLAWEVVAARTGTDEQRRRARVMLQQRMDSAPPAWVAAWCRAAIGRSLLQEPDPAQQRAGLLSLLSVPAAFAEGHPYLAGVCLAQAAVTASALGDPGSAAALLREFDASYGWHPAAQWPPLRELRAASASAPHAPPAASPNP